MRSFPLARLVVAGLGAVLATAACSDSTAPTFSDPAAISADLQQVEGAFSAPVYQSFSGLSEYMAPGGGPVASALMRAASPEALLDRDAPRDAAAAEQLRALVPSLSGPLAGPIIPDTLYGRVYVWDETAGHYVRDPNQTGPANGVRFILYAVNPDTHLPTSPLVAVGRADILDQSAGATLTLRILVQNTDGSVTYVDYTASVTPGPSSFSAAVTGFIANGQQGAALRRLDFDIGFAASETATTADVSADAVFDLANSSVSLELHDDAHLSGEVWTFARDFRFHRPGEVVTVVGELTVTQTGPDSFTVSGQVTIRINGEVFVTLTITNDGVTPSRQLTEREQAVIVHLLDALEDVWDAIEDFFDPLDHFAPAA
ncbi:MAG TPA: hypothetical protein VNI61_07000 [Gemmatimonadales bacterium]|nr:hypothetical protein [Gemmatimonadales bacterium]